MHDRIHVAVIHGDADRTGPCETVALWAASRIWERPGFILDLIEPPAPRLGTEDARQSDPRQRLARADAVVIVTPDDEQGPSASLCHLIEGAAGEWQDMPVAFVSHGGGGRTAERLRGALVAQQAIVFAGGISLTHVRRRFDEDGELPASDPAYAELDALLTALYRQALALPDKPDRPRHQARAPRVGAE